VLHAGPDLSTSRLPETLETRFLAEPTNAGGMARLKRGNLLWNEFEFEVQPWFGEPVRKLAANLHRFFHVRLQEENMAIVSGRKACDDHEEFIAYFVEALKEFDLVD
jgi:hypothetical protein